MTPRCPVLEIDIASKRSLPDRAHEDKTAQILPWSHVRSSQMWTIKAVITSIRAHCEPQTRVHLEAGLNPPLNTARVLARYCTLAYMPTNTASISRVRKP